MPRVLCTLPHASTSINGSAFSPDRGQMISEEVSEEVAASFASIPGYEVLRTPAPAPVTAPAADATKGRGGAARATKGATPSTDVAAGGGEGGSQDGAAIGGEDAAKATGTNDASASQDGASGTLPGV